MKGKQTVVGVGLLVHECDERCGPKGEEVKVGSGPAKVNSPAYLENYERIFGRQREGKA